MTLDDILKSYNEGDDSLLDEDNPYMSKDLPASTVIQVFLNTGDIPQCWIIRPDCDPE